MYLQYLSMRGRLNFKKLCAHTTMKSRRISVCGVDLWNSPDVELKQSTLFYLRSSTKKLFSRGVGMAGGCHSCFFLTTDTDLGCK